MFSYQRSIRSIYFFFPYGSAVPGGSIALRWLHWLVGPIQEADSVEIQKQLLADLGLISNWV